MEAKKYFLYPGYIFFSREHYQIETILGSCVSVCLWDKRKKYGGINHYIYADYRSDERKSISGAVAIPHLIKIMLDNGSIIENINAYVIGGAKNINLQPVVGDENVKIAKRILSKWKIKIKEIDTGGEKGRKIVFDNFSGKVKIVFLNNSSEIKKLMKAPKL